MVEQTEQLAAAIEAIVPEAAACVTPPTERWLPGIEVDTEPDLLTMGSASASEDVRRSFAAALESLESTRELLSAESKRLLFKGDTVLSKAGT